ncbi:carbonic anhydrase-related protein 10 [Nephila pilipes]|uniref:Carbonic anhydrase-related protein 10 n=1 Tax=Nephila pilipes TaxID=299642 RepID=A0A8X6UMN2_NEPPI|nr:carbonic anhydrase-related protein 10 [Nephila pilipes]
MAIPPVFDGATQNFYNCFAFSELTWYICSSYHQQVNGIIQNTGHGVVFKVDTGPNAPVVNISGGPLSYSYRVQEIHLHFGRTDGQGSEHRVGSHAFPAELQIYGYNSDLYGNMSEASQMSQGLVAIALMIQIGDPSNLELRLLTSQLHHIIYKGQQADLKSLSIRELLPVTDYYMTYDGSTTMPGCHETVTWLVINKPIYITKQQLYALRKLMQGDQSNPKAPLGNNYRPAQLVHHRVVRTNIDFNRSSVRFLLNPLIAEHSTNQPQPHPTHSFIPPLHRLSERST